MIVNAGRRRRFGRPGGKGRAGHLVPDHSGLYVQGLTGCGTMEIFRQAANGSIKVVNVPGASR